MLPAQERVLDARLIVAVIACGVMSFAGIVVETAMNVAFPALMSEFSIDTGTVQWVTTSYLLVLTCIMPISSVLKRRFRTKSLFVVAIALFFCGILLCLCAPAFWTIILGRVVQGVGTGLALPLMFNIILEQVPHDKVGLMMGFGTLITALGPAVGPSAGGLIIGIWGWRAIFVALIPLLALAGIGGIWAIRQVSETERIGFSPVQFVVLSGGFACLIFAVSAASESGWLSLPVIGLLMAAIALLVIFCKLAVGSEDPLIRVQIFDVRSFSLSAVYVLIVQMIVLGLGYLIPYYGQTVLGLSEFEAGCLLLPGCIVGAILAPIGGRILDKFGALRPLTTGAALLVIAMICFAAFGFGSSAWTIAGLYVIVPVAEGFSLANSITNGISYLKPELMTDGNAVFNTLQQLGGAVGTAVATSIVNGAQLQHAGNLLAGTVLGVHLGSFVFLGFAVVALFAMIGVFADASNRTGE